jgi:hypothetical protein
MIIFLNFFAFSIFRNSSFCYSKYVDNYEVLTLRSFHQYLHKDISAAIFYMSLPFNVVKTFLAICVPFFLYVHVTIIFPLYHLNIFFLFRTSMWLTEERRVTVTKIMNELNKANLIFLATSHFYLIQNNSGDFFIHYLSQMENFIFRNIEQIK